MRVQPWIVHCSAGIGRTGTFIAIDHGLNHLKRSGTCDVLKIIAIIRQYRGGMVQHCEQGEFVHLTLAKHIEQANHGIENDDPKAVLTRSVLKAIASVPKHVKV